MEILKMNMKKINLCSWCIQGLQSHGEKIYVGDYVGDQKCEMCTVSGEDENVMECLMETGMIY